MSNFGDAPTNGGAHRIGDQERDAATQALVAHREAGRLDAVEYEDRQVRVSRARTWADIQPIFADLPEPHPAGMPPVAAVAHPQAAVLGLGTPGVAPSEGQGLLGGVVPHRYKSTVMALTPFAALLLFFVTPGPSWIWFLAIPVMGILLYGPEGNDERRRQERWNRDERRRSQREQRRGR